MPGRGSAEADAEPRRVSVPRELAVEEPTAEPVTLGVIATLSSDPGPGGRSDQAARNRDRPPGAGAEEPRPASD